MGSYLYRVIEDAGEPVTPDEIADEMIATLMGAGTFAGSPRLLKSSILLPIGRPLAFIVVWSLGVGMETGWGLPGESGSRGLALRPFITARVYVLNLQLIYHLRKHP